MTTLSNITTSRASTTLSQYYGGVRLLMSKPRRAVA
jgi:hypothetical protein